MAVDDRCPPVRRLPGGVIMLRSLHCTGTMVMMIYRDCSSRDATVAVAGDAPSYYYHASDSHHDRSNG